MSSTRLNPITALITQARSRDKDLLPCCIVQHPRFAEDAATIKSWTAQFGAATAAELVGLTTTCCR